MNRVKQKNARKETVQRERKYGWKEKLHLQELLLREWGNIQRSDYRV